MNDLECPYCKTDQEPDEESYSQDYMHLHECVNDDCGKIFGYWVTYYPSYSEHEVPCANGEDHEWDKMCGAPKYYFVNKRRCKHCDEEKTLKADDPEFVEVVEDGQ